MTLKHTIETLNGTIDLQDDQPSKDAMIQRRDTLQNMLNSGAKDVQFVVAVMTRDEAIHLLDGTTDIFQDENTPKDYQRFQALKQQLDALLVGDAERDAWLRHYKTTREAWTPHIYADASDTTLVGFIEEIAISHHPHQFWPNFVDGDSGLFAENDATRIAAWNRLDRHYILLIDGLSLFYPHIRKTLQDFAFQGAQDGAALIFSQQKATIHPLDAEIETEIAAQMPWLFGKFETFANPLYEIGANHARRVRRWLCASVPQLMGPPSANPANHIPGTTYGINPGGPTR